MEILTRGLVSLLEAVAQEAAQDGGFADARRAEHHDAPAVLRLGDLRLVRQRLEACVPCRRSAASWSRGDFLSTDAGCALPRLDARTTRAFCSCCFSCVVASLRIPSPALESVLTLSPVAPSLCVALLYASRTLGELRVWITCRAAAALTLCSMTGHIEEDRQICLILIGCIHLCLCALEKYFGALAARCLYTRARVICVIDRCAARVPRGTKRFPEQCMMI